MSASVSVKELNRKLARLQKQRDTLNSLHTGKEMEYTYHGGYSLGYLEGKINTLEGVLDILNQEK